MNVDVSKVYPLNLYSVVYICSRLLLSIYWPLNFCLGQIHNVYCFKGSYRTTLEISWQLVTTPLPRGSSRQAVRNILEFLGANIGGEWMANPRLPGEKADNNIVGGLEHFCFPIYWE